MIPSCRWSVTQSALPVVVSCPGWVVLVVEVVRLLSWQRLTLPSHAAAWRRFCSHMARAVHEAWGQLARHSAQSESVWQHARSRVRMAVERFVDSDSDGDNKGEHEDSPTGGSDRDATNDEGSPTGSSHALSTEEARTVVNRLKEEALLDVLAHAACDGAGGSVSTCAWLVQPGGAEMLRAASSSTPTPSTDNSPTLPSSPSPSPSPSSSSAKPSQPRHLHRAACPVAFDVVESRRSRVVQSNTEAGTATGEDDTDHDNDNYDKGPGTKTEEAEEAEEAKSGAGTRSQGSGALDGAVLWIPIGHVGVLRVTPSPNASPTQWSRVVKQADRFQSLATLVGQALAEQRLAAAIRAIHACDSRPTRLVHPPPHSGPGIGSHHASTPPGLARVGGCSCGLGGCGSGCGSGCGCGDACCVRRRAAHALRWVCPLATGSACVEGRSWARGVGSKGSGAEPAAGKRCAWDMGEPPLRSHVVAGVRALVERTPRPSETKEGAGEAGSSWSHTAVVGAVAAHDDDVGDEGGRASAVVAAVASSESGERDDGAFHGGLDHDGGKEGHGGKRDEGHTPSSRDSTASDPVLVALRVEPPRTTLCVPTLDDFRHAAGRVAQAIATRDRQRGDRQAVLDAGAAQLQRRLEQPLPRHHLHPHPSSSKGASGKENDGESDDVDPSVEPAAVGSWWSSGTADAPSPRNGTAGSDTTPPAPMAAQPLSTLVSVLAAAFPGWCVRAFLLRPGARTLHCPASCTVCPPSAPGSPPAAAAAAVAIHEDTCRLPFHVMDAQQAWSETAVREDHGRSSRAGSDDVRSLMAGTSVPSSASPPSTVAAALDMVVVPLEHVGVVCLARPHQTHTSNQRGDGHGHGHGRGCLPLQELRWLCHVARHTGEHLVLQGVRFAEAGLRQLGREVQQHEDAGALRGTIKRALRWTVETVVNASDGAAVVPCTPQDTEEGKSCEASDGVVHIVPCDTPPYVQATLLDHGGTRVGREGRSTFLSQHAAVLQWCAQQRGHGRVAPGDSSRSGRAGDEGGRDRSHRDGDAKAGEGEVEVEDREGAGLSHLSAQVVTGPVVPPANALPDSRVSPAACATEEVHDGARRVVGHAWVVGPSNGAAQVLGASPAHSRGLEPGYRDASPRRVVALGLIVALHQHRRACATGFGDSDELLMPPRVALLRSRANCARRLAQAGGRAVVACMLHAAREAARTRALQQVRVDRSAAIGAVALRCTDGVMSLAFVRCVVDAVACCMAGYVSWVAW